MCKLCSLVFPVIKYGRREWSQEYDHKPTTPVASYFLDRVCPHLEFDVFPVWMSTRKLYRIRVWKGRPHRHATESKIWLEVQFKW